MIVQPWTGLFLFFSQYIYIKVGDPKCLANPGLGNALRNHFNDGQQQSYKPKHVKVWMAFHL